MIVGLYNLSKTTTLASASPGRNKKKEVLPLALEAPGLTKEYSSLEDRAYQVEIDLERMKEEKNNPTEWMNSTDHVFDG